MKAYRVGRRAAAHQHVCLQGWKAGNQALFVGHCIEHRELGTGGTGKAAVGCGIPTGGQNHCEML